MYLNFFWTGGECYCGNAISSGADYGQIAAASDCSMACTGDSTQACGGSYRVVIYKNTASSTTSVAPTSTSTSTPTTWSSVGCYVDSSVRVLAAYSPSIELNTPITCEAACASFSYKYAGVEYGVSRFSYNTISKLMLLCGPKAKNVIVPTRFQVVHNSHQVTLNVGCLARATRHRRVGGTTGSLFTWLLRSLVQLLRVRHLLPPARPPLRQLPQHHCGLH